MFVVTPSERWPLWWTRNRLQHSYQFQVVLKPNASEYQQLYLDSLKAIGIDPLVHDIRFVEVHGNIQHWAHGGPAGKFGDSQLSSHETGNLQHWAHGV